MKRSGILFELKRRRVWRVAGAYVLVMWMGVEIVLETAPVLDLPGWVPRAAVILGLAGFPITLVLAWVYDLTAHGVVRTPAADPDPDHPAAEDGHAFARGHGPVRLAGVFGAGIVVALVGFGAYSAFQPAAMLRPESIQALAVLPFTDLSSEGDQKYFADGVTEELINRLAGVGDLRVAGRTSSFAVRAEGASLADIVRTLGVDAVVEGSIRRSGDRLRVTVELVDARSGFQIWSGKYDRTVEDIFAIQDEISTAIVEALRIQLLPTSALRAGTESVRAHDAYLLGLARWNSRTEADLTRALEYFEEAVAEDQSYAPAYAGIAMTYAVLPTYSDIPADVAAELGSEAAARALALDARNAAAHAAIGQIAQSLEWNLAAAETAYRRAIEFQPSFATGHQWYAETLLMLGRLEEARAEVEHALALDPVSVAARTAFGYLQTVRREYGAARATYLDILERNPGSDLSRAHLLFLCMLDECGARAEAEALAPYPGEVAGALRHVIAVTRGADPGLALDALPGLDAALGPGTLALLHSAIGDRDGALDRIEQAYEEGLDPNLPFLVVHPLLDPVRAEPRFVRVAEGLGVEAPLAGLPPR